MSCPACFSGVVHKGTPRGQVVKLHGLETYVTEPVDDRTVKAIIVIIPDAFGFPFVNNKILADHYADKGNYRVYMPDFMLGYAAPLWLIDTMRAMEGARNPVSKTYNTLWALYGMMPFIFFNRFGRSYPVVKSFFKMLRKNEALNLPLGAAGFCWGGKHTVLLAADLEQVAGKPLIDAGFTGHPSMLSVPADIEKIARPVAFAIGEHDSQVPLATVDKIRAIVESKAEDQKGEVIVYPGCGHGFCVRADVTAALDVAKQAADAEDHCISWFDARFGLKGGC